MDRSTKEISFINISYNWLKECKCIAWLFLWNISRKKINCQCFGWFSNIIYMINNNIWSITLAATSWYIVSQKLSQIYKQYPCSILSLIVVLYDTRYDQYYFVRYYRHSIIDPLTLNSPVKNLTSVFEQKTVLYPPMAPGKLFHALSKRTHFVCVI